MMKEKRISKGYFLIALPFWRESIPGPLQWDCPAVEGIVTCTYYWETEVTVSLDE